MITPIQSQIDRDPLAEPQTRSHPGWLLLRWRSVDGGQRMLLLQTFALLLAARLALRWVPVRHILSFLERRRAALLRKPIHPGPRRTQAEVAQVRWAVEAVVRSSPIRFICFPQCLAGSLLLQRRGVPSILHYGVTRLEGKLATHTWLQVEDAVVIGGDVADEFSLISSF